MVLKNKCNTVFLVAKRRMNLARLSKPGQSHSHDVSRGSDIEITDQLQTVAAATETTI